MTEATSSRDPQRPHEKYMSILGHLEEMRSRIIRSLVAIVVGSIVSGVFIQRIFIALSRGVPELAWLSPMEPYFTYLKIALVCGLFIAFPYVLFEMWRFVSPGLYQKEKKYLVPFIVSSWMMFVLGGVFAYFVMLPTLTTMLYKAGMITASDAPRPLEERWESVAEALMEQRGQSGEISNATRLNEIYTEIQKDLAQAKQEGSSPTKVSNLWSVGRYVQMVLILFVCFGIAFNLPVVVVILCLIGVVKPQTLSKARPAVVIVIFVIAAVLTPPDAISQILMGVPMYLLFELSLILSRVLLWMRRSSD